MKAFKPSRPRLARPMTAIGQEGSTRAHLWVAQHADVQVGVAQPGSRVLQVLDGPQHDLRVEVVCDGVDILALDGQLSIEERQVELQLAMPCSSSSVDVSVTRV